MRAVKKRDPKEYESAGKFLVGAGVFSLVLPIFLHGDLGSSLRCIAMGLVAVGTGSSMITSARRRQRRELEHARKKAGDVMPNTALEPTATAPVSSGRAMKIRIPFLHWRGKHRGRGSALER